MFNRARWKLTGWYLLIIFLISITFSAVIYQLIGNEIDRLAFRQKVRWERRLEMGGFKPDNFPFDFQPPEEDPDLAAESKNRLLLILLGANSSILLLSGGLAFFLAGLTLKPIREMVDEQNRFVADASHELKTPLTALKSTFEVFLRDPKVRLVKARKLVNESLGEVDRLQNLSESLLTLVNNKTINTSTKEQVNLNQLVDKLIKKYEKLAQTKEVKLVNKIGKSTIEANSKSVEVILSNLMDNAIKYGKRGGKVELETKKEGSKICVLVKDNGVGIDAKDIPYIFDRFYRANISRSKNEVEGFGLGLAITKKIVDQIGAKINVSSTKGKGSIFSVIFQ